MGFCASKANLISAFTQSEAATEADQQRTRKRASLMELPSWSGQVLAARRLAESKKTLRRSESQECSTARPVAKSLRE